MRLDRDAAERAVAALAQELGIDTLACAEGIVRVAEHEMLGALRLSPSSAASTRAASR